MSMFSRILTAALGLFLISSGIAKFAGGHVFQYIEFKSGIDIFYPYVNHATGVAEVVAGGLVLARSTRLIGAAAAAVIMTGAVAFHLSPWLGISMPTGLADGATAPWTRSDFAATTTSVTFLLAIATLARSLTIVRTELRSRRDVAATITQLDESAVAV